MTFTVGDMEALPMSNEAFDVCISNGMSTLSADASQPDSCMPPYHSLSLSRKTHLARIGDTLPFIDHLNLQPSQPLQSILTGAFCLAPNKEKSFGEIFRVLQPGGRMAVATSTIREVLAEGVEWPICMRYLFVMTDWVITC